MKRVIVISSLLLVISFTAVAQIAGSTQQEEQNAFGASAPSAAFQSTSSMPGSGSSYSATPSLNADGTATLEGASYSPTKPKKPGTIHKAPPIYPDPLGDAVLPLLLCAFAFCGVIYLRRKKALKS